MKKPLKIFSFSILAILLLYLLLYLFKLNFLEGYERIEVIIGVLGMFATFFGAYIGAKIAGDNSRELFKQQIKMNDLQQHMDANIFVLEEVSEVSNLIKKIEINLNDKNVFYPENLEDIHTTYSEIYKILNVLKKYRLKEASIIIYHDIFKLKAEVDKNVEIFKYPISVNETPKLIENTLKIELGKDDWVSWTKNNFENEQLVFTQWKGPLNIERVVYKMSISEIVENNKNFFENKLETMNSSLKQINRIYNDMNYKNIEDLRSSYLELIGN